MLFAELTSHTFQSRRQFASRGVKVLSSFRVRQDAGTHQNFNLFEVHVAKALMPLEWFLLRI